MGIFRRKASKNEWVDPAAGMAGGNLGEQQALPDLGAGAIPASASAGQGDAGGPLRMTVSKVFSISDRGATVTGHIDSGSVAVGAEVDIVGRGGSVMTVTVGGIEGFRTILVSAQAGDAVGLLLEDTDKTSVRSGDVVVSAGSFTPNISTQQQTDLIGTRSGFVASQPAVNRASGTYVQVEILTVPTLKIVAIKVLRDHLGLALGESKSLVDNVPSMVPGLHLRADAQALVLALGSAGAHATIRG